MSDEVSAAVEDLRRRRAHNLQMGGAERVARQHERGKLTVRERLDLLFDPGSFTELGLLAHQQPSRGGAAADPQPTPRAGAVAGPGPGPGRPGWAGAYDFTRMWGSTAP